MVRILGTGEQRIDEDEPLNIDNEGTGLWARGPHNWHERNVSADKPSAGSTSRATTSRNSGNQISRRRHHACGDSNPVSADALVQ
jgi:hypothetical protein